MSYTVAEHAGVAGTHVVEVEGVLDVKAAPDLKAALEAAIERGTKILIVDLDQVKFIDSSAIGVLLAARERLLRAGGALEVACAERNVVRVLQIVGIETAGPAVAAPGRLAPPAG